jgi:hypothetical protein
MKGEIECYSARKIEHVPDSDSAKNTGFLTRSHQFHVDHIYSYYKMRVFNTSINRALQFAYSEGGSLTYEAFRQLHVEQGLMCLAEEITLFGKVAIQVHGDNGALPLLVTQLGVKAIERLLAHDVFEFVLNPTRLLIPVKTHHLTPHLFVALGREIITMILRSLFKKDFLVLR